VNWIDVTVVFIVLYYKMFQGSIKNISVKDRHFSCMFYLVPYSFMWGSTDKEVYSKNTQYSTCERKDIFFYILTGGSSGVTKSSNVCHELLFFKKSRKVVINKYIFKIMAPRRKVCGKIEYKLILWYSFRHILRGHGLKLR